MPPLKKTRILITVMLLLAMMITSALPAYALTVQDVEGFLICQCGCNKVVSNCVCASADAFRSNIANLIKQGKTREEILSSFVANYGEAVLAEPVKEGFNWAAWILPFAALAAGIAIVYFALRRWVFISKNNALKDLSEEELFIDEEESRYYSERLERELKRNL